MTARRIAAAALVVAVLTPGCSTDSSLPPPAPADPLAGVIRELRVTDADGGSFLVRLLVEGDDERRWRVTYPGTDGSAPADVSARVSRAGGGWRVASQIIVGPPPPARTILVSGPAPVSPDGPEANGDFDFFRRLVRSGVAREVVGSTALGCTTYTAPLAVAASGIPDEEEAERVGGVATVEGGETVAPIRLCGTGRELDEVSLPAHMVRRDGSESRARAGAYRFTPVSRRPATDAAIRRAFDLRAAYPDASVRGAPEDVTRP